MLLLSVPARFPVSVRTSGRTLPDEPGTVRGIRTMVHKITVSATFDNEADADAFVDAIQDLDEDNIFPEGAAVRRTGDYESTIDD